MRTNVRHIFAIGGIVGTHACELIFELALGVCGALNYLFKPKTLFLAEMCENLRKLRI